MLWNDEQYERVARWLDGDAVELTAAESALAEEIRAEEARLGDALQAAPPMVAMARARVRMIAAAARPRWHAVRWGLSGAAAAAAVLVAASLLWWGGAQPQRMPGGAPLTADMLSEAYMPESQNVDLDLIADELSDMQAEMVVGLPATRDDAEMDVLQDMVDLFWLEEI